MKGAISYKVVTLIVAIVIVIGIVAGYYYLTLPTAPKAKEPIKIGVIGPFTGPAAEQGKDMKIGAEYAAKQINEHGGILGRNVTLVFGDTESKAEVGVSVVEKLITQDKVDYIVGGFHSHVNLAVMDVAAKYHKLFIIATAASDEIGRKMATNPEKYKTVFQANINASSFQTGEINTLKWLMKTGQLPVEKKKFVLVIEDTAWGRISGNPWLDYFKNKSHWNVMTLTVSFGQTDFYSVLTKIKDFDPNIVKYEFSSPSSSVAFVKQYYELGIHAILAVDISGSHTTEWEQTAMPIAQYAIRSLEPINQSVRDLMTKLGVSDFFYEEYDAIMILKYGIEHANSFDTDAIVHVLETSEIPGVRGIHKFCPNHCACVGGKYIGHAGVQIYNGKPHWIYPPDVLKEKGFKVENFRLPPGYKP